MARASRAGTETIVAERLFLHSAIYLVGAFSAEKMTARAPSMRILTIDLEDWFHLLAFDGTRDTAGWDRFPTRFAGPLDQILEILAEANTRATFFVLGWMAERYPEAIRKVAAMGHEIGSHSYAHQLIYEQSPAEFSNDLRKSLDILSSLYGQQVTSYRAPGFSIRRDTLWAFDLLIESGIKVDCSIFPAPRAHGGLESYGRAVPRVIQTNVGRLLEFPISAITVGGGRNIAYSGGGYFRLLPWWLLRRLSRRQSYEMSYFHPADFDPDKPVLTGLSPLRRFRSRVGLKGALAKFRRYVNSATWCSVGAAAQRISDPDTIGIDQLRASV
jgi:polysaccharide deacetylase family protein (PEP-CTERM system associated)